MANNVTLSYPSAFHHQFLDLNGKLLTGGKLYTYSAGTSTPVPTYKTIGDTSSTNTNTNPIILDNAGMAYIVIETDKAYKFVLFDKNDAKIAEWDNVTGNIGGGGGGSEDIVVVGTPNEIDVSDSVTQGVKRYVISLSNSVKSTILYIVGLYTNVLNSLGNKADKVQGATAGNLAALNASGNLTDSGSKAADFKTKQTPVADPSASGAGLEFIDSVSQNANGEITPHKKSVQDGTTAQKGVVQLQDSIGSTESATDKAVTPHAVREAINAAVSSAYHAAGTKSVDQLTSSLLVAENEGCVYNITDSGTTTSDFVDGAGHPINAGDNVGVCDVGGGVYKFDLLSGFVDLSNYLTKTGDARNTTSTFTKASGDTSTITSGSKLSAIFTAISSFFASLKALAFKDKASYNDLSSGVQSSLDKANSALQSHQSVTDNNPTLAWGSTSTVGTVGSTDLRVTMPANPAIGGVAKADASIYVDGVSGNRWYKVAETSFTGAYGNKSGALEINYTDSDFKITTLLIDFNLRIQNANKPYAVTLAAVATKVLSECDVRIVSRGAISSRKVEIWIKCGASETRSSVFVSEHASGGYLYNTTSTFTYTSYSATAGQAEPTTDEPNNVYVYAPTIVSFDSTRAASWINSGTFDAARIPTSLPNTTAGNANYASKIGTSSAHPQIGSTSTPVYVDPDGQVQPCTQGATLKTNTATLYIAGTYGDGHLPYYNVKDVKNGCVNYVHVKDIPANTCSITIEAPALASGEEYDYVVVFDTFTNSNLVGTIDVENCKKAGRFENNVFVVDSMALTSGNPRYVPMIIVTGNVASSKWYERL